MSEDVAQKSSHLTMMWTTDRQDWVLLKRTTLLPFNLKTRLLCVFSDDEIGDLVVTQMAKAGVPIVDDAPPQA